MANEFIIRKGYKSLAASEVTGSLKTTGDITVSGTGLSTIAGQLYVGQTSDYFGSSTNIQLNSGASDKNVGIRSNILYLYSYNNGSSSRLIFGDGSANFSLVSNDTEFALYNYGTSSNSLVVNRSTNAATFADTVNLPSNKGVVWPGGSIRAEGNTLKLVATTLIDLQDNTQIQGSLSTSDNITMTKSSGNNQLYINSSGGGAPVIYMEDPSRKWGQFISNGHLHFKDETANLIALKIDGGTGASTFAGNVTLNSRLTFDYGGDHYFEAGTNSLSYKSSGGTSVMTLNASTQAATFGGNVTVAGSLTAQEFHTEIVSASVLFDSGSTKFGNSSDDIHDFTGSLKVLGNTAAYSLDIKGGADARMLVEATSTAARYDLKTSSHHRFLQLIHSDGRFRFYDQTNGSERFTILADGKVGIGHTSLYQKFTVNGNIDIRGGDGSFLTFNNGDANITIHNNGSGRDLSFKTYDPDNGNNAERMRIRKDGNVGIGTNNPLGKLHVYNTSTTSDGDATATMTTSGQDSILLYGHGGTNGQTYGSITWMGGSRRRAMITAVAENTDTDYIGLAFYTRGVDGAGDYNESMRVTHGGSVGIGVTGPQEKLHVYHAGTSRIEVEGTSGPAAIKLTNSQGSYGWYVDSGANTLRLYNFNAGSDIATFSATGQLGLGGASSPNRLLHIDNTSNATKASAYFYTNAVHTGTDSQAHVSIYSDHASSSGDVLHVRGDGSGNLLTLNKGGADKFVIDDDGNITAKGGLLTLGEADTSSAHINSYELMTFNIDSDNDDTNRYFAWYKNGSSGGGTEMMRLTEDGRLGIGEASPDEFVHLKTAEATIKFESTHGKTSFINQGGGNFHIKAVHSSGVGINYGDTTNPAVLKLYNNTTAAVALRASGISYFTGGRVGIGTTSPGAKLDVAGSNAVIWINPADGAHAGLHFRQAGAFKGFVGYNDSTDVVNIGMDGSIVNGININSSHNVGIGTSSPLVKLDVNGVLYSRGGTWNGGGSEGNHTNVGLVIEEEDFIYTKDGDNLRKILGKTSDIIEVGMAGTSLIDGISFLSGTTPKYRWYSNSSEIMRLNATGLGIGTSAPAEKLEVNGSVKIGNIKIQNSGGGRIGLNRNTATGAIYDNSIGAFQLQNNTGVLELQAYNSSGTWGGSLYYATNGRLGLGVSTPGAQFHVKNVSGDNRGILVENTVAASYAEVQLKAAREFRIGTGGSSTSANAASAFYVYDATTGGTAGHRFEISSAGDVQGRRVRSNTAGDVALSLQPTDSTIHYGFRIDSSTNSFNLDRVDSAGQLLRVTAAGNATFVGTVTGTYFYGDGSNLTGISATNADTVDNLHAASFFRSDAADSAIGFSSSTSVNGTGDSGLNIVNGGRLGFDQSGTRSWNFKAASGQLQLNSGDNGGSVYFGTDIVSNNKQITGLNNLAFNDPGPNEGIAWSGGNWKIYESPNDLTTNTAGNLQFVSGSTRVLSIGKTGETALEVIGSGSTVFEVVGSQGQLFSVTDDLTGTLFAVSDISGTPLFEVDGDSTITMGDFGTNALVVTGSKIGVGTATPAYPFHAYSGGSERFAISGDVFVRGATDLKITGTNRRLSFDAGTGTVRTSTSNDLILQTNSTTAITIDTNQNTIFSQPVWVQDYIYHHGDSNTYFGFSGNDTFIVGTSGSTRLTINSSGNVTIPNNLYLGPTLDLSSDGSSSYTNSRIILRSTQSNARGAGVFMHNTNDDQEFYMGVPYSSGFDKWMVGYKGTADHSDSTAAPGQSVFEVDTSGNAILKGKLASAHTKYCSVSISNSYVRVYYAAASNSQLSTAVRLTGTTHGSSHVANFTADILVNHYQDVFIRSTSGAYTQVTLKVESNNNGDYTLSVKSASSNASTYRFKVEAISDNITLTTLPSSTSATNTTHEHTTQFGTNETGEGGTLQHKYGGLATFASHVTLTDGILTVNDGNNYVKISEGSNSIGQIELKDSTSVFVQGWGSDFRVAVNGDSGNHALIINSSKLATLTGNVNIDGKLTLDSASSTNGIINTPASLRLNIDSNNNQTGEKFVVGHNQDSINNSNELFVVNESGNGEFAGSVTIGNKTVTSSTTNHENVLRVKGKNNYSNGTTWYGTYGQILLHSDTNMTSSARRFLITNAYENNKFAIVRSVDGNTDPVVNSTSAGVNSGTADFIINNSGNATFGGTVTHQGVELTTGTSIDQIKQFSMTFQLTANTWTDTGIDGGDLTTGTYAMQVFVDDYGVGGGHYSEYYSATISWYSSSTNSTMVDEIVMHRAGHAPNAGDIQLRTQRAAGSDSHDLMLQIKHNQSYNAALNNTSGKNMKFKFRRLM